MDALVAADVRAEEALALLKSGGGSSQESEPAAAASEVELSLGEVEELTASQVAMEIEDDRDGSSGLLEIVDLDDDSMVSEVEQEVADESLEALVDDEDDDFALPSEDDLGASMTAGNLTHDPFDDSLPDQIDEVSVVDDEDLSMTGAVVVADDDEEAVEEAVDDAVEWPDISEELEELDFYLAQDLEDDARVTYLEIVRQHPGHPGLAAFSHLMEEANEETAEGEESLVDVDEEAPSFSFDDDEDDGDYLASIFDSESSENKPRKSAAKVEHKARAEVSDAAATDHYDLGVAYHGMGLGSDAIAAFDRAAEDPEWKCRAAIMVANILSSQGDVDGAVARLRDGLELARNDDESSESQFEIALLLKQQGDDSGALETMAKVSAGFRDRDERLAEWGG